MHFKLGSCSVVDNASKLYVGGMSSIPIHESSFHYFPTTPQGEEFARLKPRLGILVYESNEKCKLIKNL